MAAAAILFLMDLTRKLIRSQETMVMVRCQITTMTMVMVIVNNHTNLNAIQPAVHKLWCPQVF